jgi:ssDNA-binding Zn-finger/Zn-ribbon topoisomerase 1
VFRSRREGCDRRIRISDIATVTMAPTQSTRCGKRVVLRETADGAFWGCSSFPRCFASRPLKGDEWKSLESNH